jgi:hypothetical protein
MVSLIILRLLVVGMGSGAKVGVFLGKVRLYVQVREQGARIESVPLKRLVELSGYRKTRWSFVDGWLVLEAF